MIEAYVNLSSSITIMECSRNLLTNVYEDERVIEIAVEIPGVTKRGITIEVRDNVLFLVVEKREGREIKNRVCGLREQEYGIFTRSFHITDNVFTCKKFNCARYKDGVLTVTLFKTSIKGTETAYNINLL